MRNVSQILYDRKWISSVLFDKAKVQFSQLWFKTSDEWSELFNKFNRNRDRFDEFYYDLVASNQEFCERWSVFLLFLIISHGNVVAGSEFYVNRDILVLNLKEISLVSQYQVYNSIICKSGVLNVEITNKVLLHGNYSHPNY